MSKIKVMVAKTKIDAKEFAVPAQDHKGHSARVNFRVTPEMRRAISIVLATAPETGWVTDSDFWRWAGRYGLSALEKMIQNGEISNMNRQMEAIRRIMIEQERLMEFEQSFELAVKTIQGLEMNNPKEVRSTLQKLDTLINNMDNDSWREAWQKRFKTQFAHLLGGKR